MKKKYSNPTITVYTVDTTNSIMLGSAEGGNVSEKPTETMGENESFDASSYRNNLWK